MTHREASFEERAALNVISNPGPFILVPVRFNGEDRFAVGIVDGSVVKLLAICINPAQDDQKITAADGTIPRSPTSSSSLLN